MSNRELALKLFLERLKLEDTIDSSTLLLIDQALTHVSANRQTNFDRLEFLGDAVLRLAATEFINRNFPSLSVGSCSNLRAQLVSDRWLSELAEQLKLDSFILKGHAAASCLEHH